MHANNPHTTDKFALSYITLGKGKKPVIAFHGFGQDSSYYAGFGPALGKEYTIYSFDLPYHGNDDTEKTENPIDRDTLRDFFQTFMESHGIMQFTNIGFSIGAKLSLVLLELFPEKTEQIILMAPDGFRTNIWYKLATGSKPTRSLFKYITYHPDFFLRFSDAMVNMKLIHPGISRFARSQMNSSQKREKVYYTWMFFRMLRFPKNRILKTLVEYKIPLSIFLGSDDKIIQPGQFRFLSEEQRVNFQMFILDTGHNHLIEKTAEYLGGNVQ